MGVPAGCIVDRPEGLGEARQADRLTIGGLMAMLIGSSLLSVIPPDLGVAGYVAPLAVITAGYALFQAANNTAVMAEIGPDERGVVSAMLTLSRNLGLVTGASVMGAVYTIASGANEVTVARPGAIAVGMQVAFGVAALLVIIALIVALASRVAAGRAPQMAGNP